MNFENLMHDTSISQDYHRLIELCGSYGLNEEETNQIISDFKNGSFAQPDQSIDESFQESLRNLDYNNAHETDRHSNEEYSFKHQKGNNFKNITSSHMESIENESQHMDKNSRNIGISEEILETYMKERRMFQQNIYRRLEEQNEELKKQLRAKQQKIEMFMRMKVQDSDVIQDLKDTIKNLVTQLHEKDQAYKSLSDQYEKYKTETMSNMGNRSSKAELSHHESIVSIEDRERKSMVKENCLTEIDQNRQLIKKSSQKYIKQFSKSKNSSHSNFQQNRQNIMKNEQAKRSGIDINKYKGMIEKLRNSYQFR